MKKILLLATFAFFTLQANATSYVSFSGNDIIALAASFNSTLTPTIGDGKVELKTGEVYRTYSHESNTSGNLLEFNSWISSFGNGQGITAFNLWLQDGHSNQAAMWGETIALKDAYSTNIHPFASPGWEYSVVTAPSSWGSWWEGRQLICYSATSADYYLRPGGTAVSFGFTADIIGNNGATGPDYQMWVGSDTIVDDAGATFFQRAISAHVPEPTTLYLLSLSLGALSLVGCRKK